MNNENRNDSALPMDVNVLREENERLRGRVAALEEALAEREAFSPRTGGPLAVGGAPGEGTRAGAIPAPPPADPGGLPYALEATLDATAGRRAEEALREDVMLHAAILDNSTLTAYIKDRDGRYILANSRARALVGLTWEELCGKTDYDILPKELADSYVASDREVMETGVTTEREDRVTLADGNHYYVTTKFPLRGPKGEVRGACSISTDITTYRRAEEENRRLQEEVIRIQEESLRALSTPLMPIAKGVVVMPLIGHIDRARAQRVLEALLDGIVAHAAGSVILDVTGVPVVDEEVASSLVRTAMAAKLLGASVILTGVQPAMARTLVSLGADLRGVVNEGTLESGIARALRR